MKNAFTVAEDISVAWLAKISKTTLLGRLLENSTSDLEEVEDELQTTNTMCVGDYMGVEGKCYEERVQDLDLEPMRYDTELAAGRHKESVGRVSKHLGIDPEPTLGPCFQGPSTHPPTRHAWQKEGKKSSDKVVEDRLEVEKGDARLAGCAYLCLVQTKFTALTDLIDQMTLSFK